VRCAHAYTRKEAGLRLKRIAQQTTKEPGQLKGEVARCIHHSLLSPSWLLGRRPSYNSPTSTDLGSTIRPAIFGIVDFWVGPIPSRLSSDRRQVAPPSARATAARTSTKLGTHFQVSVHWVCSLGNVVAVDAATSSLV
jgi:hypothetical protein